MFIRGINASFIYASKTEDVNDQISELDTEISFLNMIFNESSGLHRTLSPYYEFLKPIKGKKIMFLREFIFFFRIKIVRLKQNLFLLMLFHQKETLKSQFCTSLPILFVKHLTKHCIIQSK